MSKGTSKYLETSSDPTSPTEMSQALTAGVSNSFSIGLIFAIIALILSFFIKRTKAPEEN
jgi:DHA2 family lincomycin resistance protein-like MFS transporter